jgi:hypothetical protein
MTYWWIRYLHPDEPKTRVNPDGHRTRLLSVDGDMPLEADLDAFRERQGNKITIIDISKSTNNPFQRVSY